MSDPYLILGVAPDADDDSIQSAYLAAVKASPPERDARRFEAIRRAYEAIRSRRDRLAFELFDTTPPTPMEVLERAAPLKAGERPDLQTFLALLQGER